MKNEKSSIVGHAKILSYLETAISNEKLAHAYIFSGSAQLGKSTVCDFLIQKLLCQGDEKPCNECALCKQVSQKTHPDISIVEKEEDKKNITVEQVRALKNYLSLSSLLQSYKFGIIYEAELLHESAQNALLKLLEEPTPKTILILLTSDYSQLLPTIISRSQVIKFYQVTEQEIYEHLVRAGSERGVARKSSILSYGRPGKAIEISQSEDAFKNDYEAVEGYINLLNGDFNTRLQSLAPLFQKKGSHQENVLGIRKYLNDLQLFLRDLMHYSAGGNVSLKEREKGFSKIEKDFSPQKISELMREIESIKNHLSQNINSKILLENLLLKF